jgi:hypothetical protein
MMRMTAAAKRESEIKALAAGGDDAPPKSSKLWEWLKAAF